MPCPVFFIHSLEQEKWCFGVDRTSKLKNDLAVFSRLMMIETSFLRYLCHHLTSCRPGIDLDLKEDLSNVDTWSWGYCRWLKPKLTPWSEAPHSAFHLTLVVPSVLHQLRGVRAAIYSTQWWISCFEVSRPQVEQSTSPNFRLCESMPKIHAASFAFPLQALPCSGAKSIMTHLELG